MYDLVVNTNAFTLASTNTATLLSSYKEHRQRFGVVDFTKETQPNN